MSERMTARWHSGSFWKLPQTGISPSTAGLALGLCAALQARCQLTALSAQPPPFLSPCLPQIRAAGQALPVTSVRGRAVSSARSQRG